MNRTERFDLKEYPEGFKFKYIEQEYIPVLDLPDSEIRKNTQCSDMMMRLTYGDLISANGYVYGVLEVRRHGVLVKHDVNSRVFMIQWKHVAPVHAGVLWLLRLGFRKKQYRMVIDNSKVEMYSLEIMPEVWVHTDSTGLGYTMVNEILLEKRLTKIHQVQNLLYSLTGDYYKKMPANPEVTADLKKVLFEAIPRLEEQLHKEAFIPDRLKNIPAKYDNLRDDLFAYASEYERLRYIRRKVVVPSGEVEDRLHGSAGTANMYKTAPYITDFFNQNPDLVGYPLPQPPKKKRKK